MTERVKTSPLALGANGRMVVTFLLVLGGLNFLYYAESKLELGMVDRPYTNFVTWVSAQTADMLLPYPVTSQGNALIADMRTTVFVASGCNGLEAIFLMVAGIVAFPASWSRRWRGMAKYVGLLFLLNMVRVVFLVHVAHRYRDYLNVAHYQVAQGILIVFVLFFWVQYIRGSTSR